MDPMLQRHCARYIYAIPEGLRELMSDISREVLRTQPTELYTFIADYLDALMITRENARVAARLIEVITEIATTITDFLVRTGLSRGEADFIVSKIQTAFRKHLEKDKCIKEEEETEEEEQAFIDSITDELAMEDLDVQEAAILIQRAYREFKARQSREADLLRGIVDWRVAARSTINLYKRTGVTYAEANRAATLIKAAYKGYYTRRVMRRLLERGAKEYADYLMEIDYEGEGEAKLPEEDDGSWGWCYCFVDDDKQQTHVPTAVTSRVTSASSSVSVVGGVLTSIIKDVVPSMDVESEFEWGSDLGIHQGSEGEMGAEVKEVQTKKARVSISEPPITKVSTVDEMEGEHDPEEHEAATGDQPEAIAEAPEGEEAPVEHPGEKKSVAEAAEQSGERKSVEEVAAPTQSSAEQSEEKKTEAEAAAPEQSGESKSAAEAAVPTQSTAEQSEMQPTIEQPEAKKSAVDKPDGEKPIAADGTGDPPAEQPST